MPFSVKQESSSNESQTCPTVSPRIVDLAAEGSLTYHVRGNALVTGMLHVPPVSVVAQQHFIPIAVNTIPHQFVSASQQVLATTLPRHASASPVVPTSDHHSFIRLNTCQQSEPRYVRVTLQQPEPLVKALVPDTGKVALVKESEQLSNIGQRKDLNNGRTTDMSSEYFKPIKSSASPPLKVPRVQSPKCGDQHLQDQQVVYHQHSIHEQYQVLPHKHQVCATVVAPVSQNKPQQLLSLPCGELAVNSKALFSSVQNIGNVSTKHVQQAHASQPIDQQALSLLERKQGHHLKQQLGELVQNMAINSTSAKVQPSGSFAPKSLDLKGAQLLMVQPPQSSVSSSASAKFIVSCAQGSDASVSQLVSSPAAFYLPGLPVIGSQNPGPIKVQAIAPKSTTGFATGAVLIQPQTAPKDNSANSNLQSGQRMLLPLQQSHGVVIRQLPPHFLQVNPQFGVVEFCQMPEAPVAESSLPPPTSQPLGNSDPVNSKLFKKLCNCTKSQCLKLYCECFANGEFCSGCNCQYCFNNIDHEADRSRAIKACLDRNPYAFHPKIGKGKVKGDTERRHTKGCNCKRSGCLKNYCECYEAKILCSSLCKCVGCKNFEESPDRKTLMHLADAAEVRVLQQNAARSKLEAQIESNPVKALVPGSLKMPFTFMTSDVAKATCDVLLAACQDAEMAQLTEAQAEKCVLEEFGRCLSQIIGISYRHRKGLS